VPPLEVVARPQFFAIHKKAIRYCQFKSYFVILTMNKLNHIVT
jgi:hypothetical protein